MTVNNFLSSTISSTTNFFSRISHESVTNFFNSARSKTIYFFQTLPQEMQNNGNRAVQVILVANLLFFTIMKIKLIPLIDKIIQRKNTDSKKIAFAKEGFKVALIAGWIAGANLALAHVNKYQKLTPLSIATITLSFIALHLLLGLKNLSSASSPFPTASEEVVTDPANSIPSERISTDPANPTSPSPQLNPTPLRTPLGTQPTQPSPLPSPRLPDPEYLREARQQLIAAQRAHHDAENALNRQRGAINIARTQRETLERQMTEAEGRVRTTETELPAETREECQKRIDDAQPAFEEVKDFHELKREKERKEMGGDWTHQQEVEFQALQEKYNNARTPLRAANDLLLKHVAFDQAQANYEHLRQQLAEIPQRIEAAEGLIAQREETLRLTAESLTTAQQAFNQAQERARQEQEVMTP